MGGCNVLRIAIFPQFTHKFNTIPIKMPVEFFKELDKNKFKIFRGKETGRRLQKEEGGKNGGLVLLNVGTLHKAT